ncbi:MULTISPECIES: permease [unclassified Fusibacter]|uniref:permease n=1 Tax=unclassified Fusibacter TaxID=2624464 RepID=UPI001010CB80|nr:MULTISPECIES: permease [unclassified Fusibacter]MCK8059272.1 permease [Fusibacter sp. A2]NPE21264.1 permease [Fusibacter sp. A1]RXV62529.1 permease [Fusibacter sp. A1]
MFEALADYLIIDLLKIEPGFLREALHFFVYDTTKILFLLTVMVFIISFIRSFVQVERVKELLNKQGGWYGYLMSATLGVFSPFCSCSTVPIFIGFVEGGIPLGMTFTFLLTSPIVNEIALSFLLITFGWKIALIYTLSGMVIGIVSGIIIEKLDLYHHVAPYIFEMNLPEGQVQERTLKDRLEFAVQNVFDIIKRVWLFVVIGIALGALMHAQVPADWFVKYASASNPFAVFVAVAGGIPLYSNSIGIIPVVEVAINKGVGLGTALSFMMSVVALSLPEMILLKKVISTKLIAIFVGITGFGILLTGYLFNALTLSGIL